MSEKTLPQLGQWWQHNEHGRVLIVGFDDGDPVFKVADPCEGWIYECQLLQWFTAAARHIPDCTGWDWQPKRKGVWRLWIQQVQEFPRDPFAKWIPDDVTDFDGQLVNGWIRTKHTEEREE